jgi:endonuclease G
VPTHFFKVVLCETESGDFELYSYVLPNACCPPDVPLTSYLVPVDSIERAAGFLLFDRITKTKLKMMNGKKS